MYKYEDQKKNLFSEKGIEMLTEIRDRARKLLAISGAVRLQEAISGTCGDSWDMLACVDYMVEHGELREIKQEDVPGQYRVFVRV